MEKKKGGRKSWHVSTLVRRALNSKSDDSYWGCVRELHWRGNIEVFQAAKKYCNSSKVRERCFGAEVLAQLGVTERPFRKETLQIFHKLLKTEASAKVLYSVLVAISHSQESKDVRGTKIIAGFRCHPSKDVRYGVAFALAGRKNSISVSTLIYLSRDKSPDVRDWATFGLGALIELDTPAIRKALFNRLDDSDGDTRGEAMVGLARRKDPRVKSFIILEIERKNETAYNYVYDAAEEFGDKKLISLVERQL